MHGPGSGPLEFLGSRLARRRMSKDSEKQKQARDQARLIADVAMRKDRQAFVSLFGYFAPRIKSLLMRGGAPAEMAEDLAQEAMISVWRKASCFDPARASPAAWIFTIARNLRIDVARRSQREKVYAVLETVEPDGPEQPDAIITASQRESKVREALNILPPEQLEVVRLAFTEGMSQSEIAEALKLPLGTVKSRTRLAMTRLRQKLEEVR